ncbi:MAG: glycosyltransferase family 9 protein [Ignavibacteria bacterium]
MIEKDKVKNILVTRTDRLGDVILTLPLLSCLKKVFPDAKLFFLVNVSLKGLLECYEGIDEIIYTNDLKDKDALTEIIRSKEIDMAINVKPDFNLASIFYRLGIKYRIGTAYRWFSFLYNYKVRIHRKRSDLHESELNLLMIKSFFNEECGNELGKFNIEESKKFRLTQKLSKFNFELSEKYVIIHPGSGGSAKDFPADKFIEFTKMFSIDYENFKVVLTGLQGENELSEKIIIGSGIEKSAVNLCGKLDLGEMLMLINDCSLFISNSTGPIHIAGALNKKIIGFYPNEKPMHAGRWKPLGNDVEILSPESTKDEMIEIDSKKIMNAVKKLI